MLDECARAARWAAYELRVLPAKCWPKFCDPFAKCLPSAIAAQAAPQRDARKAAPRRPVPGGGAAAPRVRQGPTLRRRSGGAAEAKALLAALGAALG